MCFGMQASENPKFWHKWFPTNNNTLQTVVPENTVVPFENTFQESPDLMSRFKKWRRKAFGVGGGVVGGLAGYGAGHILTGSERVGFGTGALGAGAGYYAGQNLGGYLDDVDKNLNLALQNNTMLASNNQTLVDTNASQQGTIKTLAKGLKKTVETTHSQQGTIALQQESIDRIGHNMTNVLKSNKILTDTNAKLATNYETLVKQHQEAKKLLTSIDENTSTNQKLALIQLEKTLRHQMNDAEAQMEFAEGNIQNFPHKAPYEKAKSKYIDIKTAAARDLELFTRYFPNQRIKELSDDSYTNNQLALPSSTTSSSFFKKRPVFENSAADSGSSLPNERREISTQTDENESITEWPLRPSVTAKYGINRSLIDSPIDIPNKRSALPVIEEAPGLLQRSGSTVARKTLIPSSRSVLQGIGKSRLSLDSLGAFSYMSAQQPLNHRRILNAVNQLPPKLS